MGLDISNFSTVSIDPVEVAGGVGGQLPASVANVASASVGQSLVVAAGPLPAFANADIIASAFGVVADGVTDDTTAWRAAIAAAAVPTAGLSGDDVPSRRVRHPGGRSKVTGTLALPSNVSIDGSGAQSCYFLKSGTAFDLFTLASTGNAGIELRNFGIICNDGGGGINFANQTAPTSILGDARHVFENLVITSPGAAFFGLTFSGTECRVNNVTVQRPAGIGVNVGGSDHMIQQVTIGGGTGTGNVFQASTSNCRFVDVKIYGSLGSLNLAGLRNTYVALEVQDTSNAGGIVSCNASHTSLIGLLIDSCRNSSGGQVLSMNGANNKIQGIIIANRGGGAYTSDMAINTGGAGSTHQVELQLIGPFASRAIASIANLQGSTIRLNNSDGSTSIAYAATITPQSGTGRSWQIGAVTGNLTIANPTTAFAASGNDFWPGQELAFTIPVDATGGYTLAFGANYKLVGAAAPALAANTVVQIAFKYDGTVWRERYRAIT